MGGKNKGALGGGIAGAVLTGNPSGAIMGAGMGQNPSNVFGNATNPGILGTGQFKAQTYDPNADVFNADQTKGMEAVFLDRMREAEGRKAPVTAAAKLAQANMANAAMINQNPQAQFRGQQATLANQLAAQAQGQGPSLAMNQLRQGTDRNIQQAMAMAASQRGGNPALGLRQLGQQVTMANQQAAADASNLRMQEQMAARDQLGGLLGAARGQDIGLATDQAGLQQQAGLANQDARNQFALQQAAMQQQANLANQQSALQQQQINNQASQFFGSGLMNASQANRDAQIALENLRVQNALGVNASNQAGYASTAQARGNMISGFGQGLATMASDENLKKNVEGGDGSLKKFLGALSAKQYDYKDPKFGKGKHVSPMAQDLEKTDLGDGLVVDTPEGKMVDYAKAGGLMLASAAMLNDRMGDLEAKMKKAFAARKKANG